MQLEAVQRSLASRDAALAAATAAADELRAQLAAAHAERRDSEAATARARDGLERREAQLQRIADLYRSSSEAATARVGALRGRGAEVTRCIVGRGSHSLLLIFSLQLSSRPSATRLTRRSALLQTARCVAAAAATRVFRSPATWLALPP